MKGENKIKGTKWGNERTKWKERNEWNEGKKEQ